MVSLIITVKNEHAHLPEWLASIGAQTMSPDEIIIVDGGSTDGTWEWLQTVRSAQVKIFQKIGNIAAGRNYAVSQAVGEIIVATDAGCIYEPTWLTEIILPFTKNGAVCAATAFKPWLQPDDPLPLFLWAAATTPARGEFNKNWLPSSRSVAFLKSVWQEVGGYPEWIPYGEDVIFDLKINRHDHTFFFVREPLVAWRPRPSFPAYLRQLFNYTRSDGHGKLWYGRQAIRFATYFGLLVLLALAIQNSWWWLVPTVLAGSVYLKKFWHRFWEFSASKKIHTRILGLLFLPGVIAAGDLAKMAGWLLGVVERWCGQVRYKNES